MRKKLLNKTLSAYILFSLGVLVVSAPLFYFLTERLFLDDADETLLLNKREFVEYAIPAMKRADIVVWNKMNRDIKIEVRQFVLSKDSIFSHFYVDSIVNESEPYRVLITPVVIDGELYTYIARISLVESDDVVENIALLFAVIVCLLLLGFFILTRQLSRKLWKSFYATLEQIEQFEVYKNSIPVLNETTIEEFYRLHTAINNLIERNIRIYKSQQEFIENAAHEMQTPLAVFQAKIDVIIQSPDITQEQSELFVELYSAASRLNKLNKNLLLLSKIENNHYEDIESISVKDILIKQLDFFNEQAAEKHIVIEANYSADVYMKANLFLVEILISNLLLNAIRHNIDNGELKFSLEEKRLTVSNTGAEQALIPDKLFQRFSKVNPSEKGSGLGLSIVKRIAELYGWKIQYAHTSNVHEFIVEFN